LQITTAALLPPKAKDVDIANLPSIAVFSVTGDIPILLSFLTNPKLGGIQSSLNANAVKTASIEPAAPRVWPVYPFVEMNLILFPKTFLNNLNK